MNLIYKSIDFIDKVGNNLILPFFEKIYNLLKEKTILFKVIIFDYFIIQNWFINGLIILIIYSVDNNNLISGLIGAVFTFNLINGYSYYNKYILWKENKKNLLPHIHDFLHEYRMYLQYHKFPFSHKSILSKHLDIDNYCEKHEVMTALSQRERESDTLIEMYSYYENLMTEFKSKKPNINQNEFENFMIHIKKANGSINQDLTLSMIYFNENIELLTLIQTLMITMSRMNRYYEHKWYDHDPELFIQDNLKLISILKKVSKSILT